ncbi:hypothetical protein A3K55_02420 [Candidatus Shapirobacteria bacterium RBG_13_44_7]|uniref:Phosphoribosyltransferase domain-containing protein n=1 Tax=Candidatus Shapirobacteria bacterium RBG_13_44_7 TaxID=1802149 RepID=A0A1F7SKI0_9BACT|nr:MAG: hypothetical protein A3K55_02420 [Candidatus Shapirobacteria bacterium RBG_13_44_7]
MSQKQDPPSLEEIFLQCPKVFNYSPAGSIQYATKAFTPINLNLEIIACLPQYRQIVVDKLLTETNNYNQADYICGIESGGSYFASAIANAHKKKVIFLRRTEKIEGDIFSRVVGEIPLKDSRICLIDDVVSTGLTLLNAKKIFQQLGCTITEAKIIFSYGFDKDIEKQLKISITSISSYPKLITLAKRKGIVSEKEITKLDKYIHTFKHYLTQKKII